jgi:hypothetical protein
MEALLQPGKTPIQLFIVPSGTAMVVASCA